MAMWQRLVHRVPANLSISLRLSYSSAAGPHNPPPDQRKAQAVQTPEQLARQTIDALLTAAGWLLQDRDQFDRNAALGVVLRGFSLPAGQCDYLLFVDGKAAGVIEAKKTGVTLSGVAEQSEKYTEVTQSRAGGTSAWRATLPATVPTGSRTLEIRHVRSSDLQT